MRKINKPTEDAVEVFTDCISKVKNSGLRNRLEACNTLVRNASEELNNLVTKGRLYKIKVEEIINGNVYANELADVYTLRMAKIGSSGRALYDKIKLSAPFGICPLCVQNEVKTLDHYLPKAFYPLLAVSPNNLVPSCTDCNKSKLGHGPKRPDEEMLHPYFDNIENIQWLKASVVRTKPASIAFKVGTSSEIDELLAKRIYFHFKTLSLNILYSIQAASELRQINFRLDNLFKKDGASGVKNYLMEGVETRSHANINSWQSAMYKAMSEDDWFCGGGFRM